jgi:hypothetical protein
MAGFRSTTPSRRSKDELVVCVGWHAYVNWTPPPDQPQRPVPMMDAAGQVLANDLSDGQEVEIVSWRPRSRDGLAYQVRRVSDGSEWWVASTYLRRQPNRAVAPPSNRDLGSADTEAAR